MIKANKWILIRIIIAILIAAISITVLSKVTTSQEFHKKTIESLDRKKNSVLALSGAATAASVIITTIPGDTATPIATKLADISSYFLLVLCAIYLEKYMLTVTGYVVFTFLIPGACILYALNQFVRSASLQKLCRKLAVFGLAIFLVVPISVHITDYIEETYGTSIQETFDKATSIAKENDSTEEEVITEDDKEENKSWATRFSEAIENFANTTENMKNSVVNTVADAIAVAKTILNSFIEALALLIVTTCIIPILILALLFWIIKLFLGVDFGLSGLAGPFGSMTKES